MSRARLLILLPLVLLAACDNPLGMKPGADSVLQGFRPPTPTEAADMALDEYNADRRFRGTLLLANAPFAGEDVYLRLFEQRVNDEDPGVRSAAVRGLGMHGRPEHALLLAERLLDVDVGVRAEAARGLQRLHNPAVVEPLIAALDIARETEPTVRLEAARALGQYARPAVIEKLIASLADDSLAVNAATQSSLRTLTGQDFGYDRAAWQSWYAGTGDYFAARNAYLYPVFSRGRRWWEHIPFLPPPPNEPQAMPAGMSPTNVTGPAP